MIVSEIMNELFKWCPINRENKSDVPIYGDMSRDVSKVAVCMIATPDVLRRASEAGAEFLITHEPTFHDSIANYKDEPAFLSDPVYLAKKS